MNWDYIKPPFWDDAPVYLVGGGPSLRGFDFSRLKGKGHVVGINQSMFDCPCECGVTIDHPFMRNRSNALYEFGCQRQLFIVTGADPEHDCLVKSATYMWGIHAPGLSMDVEYLHKGSTSGYAALGIAVLKRARMIILLGYDYSTDGSAHHYHSHYPWYHRASSQSWGMWAKKYEPASVDCSNLGVTVLNASPRSALTCFRKITLDDALDVASLSATA